MSNSHKTSINIFFMKISKFFMVFLAFSIFLSVTNYAQNADEIYKRNFSKYQNELKAAATGNFSKTLTDNFRNEYAKMKKASGILEKMPYEGAIDASNCSPFQYKDLTELKKNGELEKLRTILQKDMLEMKTLVKDSIPYSVDSIECVENISIMMEMSKQEDWNRALQSWSNLYKYYPLATTNVYITGRKIIRNKINEILKEAQKEQKAGNKDKVNQLMAEKEKWVDTLLIMHDTRIKNLPKTYQEKKSKGVILGDKAGDLHTFRQQDGAEEIYKISKESVELENLNSGPSVVNMFFIYSDKLYSTKKLSSVNVVDDYFKASEVLKSRIDKLNTIDPEKYKEEIKNCKLVLEQINSVFVKGDYSTCEVLIPAFTQMIKDRPKDMELKEKAINIFTKKSCTTSELYEQLAVEIYTGKPSADAAANLAVYYIQKEPVNYDNVEKYYTEAYTLETNAEKKAEYYFKSAQVATKRGQYSKAMGFAQKAIGQKSNYGDAYILIAQLYVAGKGSCGADAVEQSYVYWVAVDKLYTAKNVDPAVSEKANQLIAEYTARFPKFEDVFQRTKIVEGQTYSIGCWINETTKVRFRIQK